MNDAPEVRGSSVVRIVGIVSAAETLFAPLSGRECVFYVATAHAQDADGPVLVREQRGLAFELNDGTGRALVDPEGARTPGSPPRARPSARPPRARLRRPPTAPRCPRSSAWPSVPTSRST